MKEAELQLEDIRSQQTVLQNENQDLMVQVEQLQGKVATVTEEKTGAEQRARDLEGRMEYIEKENAELKRRIELISSLRGGNQLQQQV